MNFERITSEHPGLIEFWQSQHTVYGPDSWKTLVEQISEMWYTPLGYTEADLRGVTAATLISLGDRDSAIPVEEALYMYRLLPNAELAIAPNADHGFPEPTHPSFALILDFLLRHRETDPA